jgi:hypothetical protein
MAVYRPPRPAKILGIEKRQSRKHERMKSRKRRNYVSFVISSFRAFVILFEILLRLRRAEGWQGSDPQS